MKALSLLVATNVAVMAMMAIIVKILGLEPVLAENGLNLTSLFVLSAVMGFAGSFISLFMSKTMVKRQMGVQVIEQPQNEQQKQFTGRSQLRPATNYEARRGRGRYWPRNGARQ